jgi:lysophospholipid acyltransferase (LPLAT)-like uncharacterized protein
MSFHVILSLVLTWALRLLGATWRVRREFEPNIDALNFQGLLRDGPVVFAFFHGQQLPMIYAHRDLGLVGMASKSADGELLAQSIGRMGYGVLRGSTSRGGAQAVRQAVRLMREDEASPCLAVDGPRGPRFEPQGGAMAIAALAQRPVVAAVAVVSKAWRLNSWDHFLIPMPFAQVAIRYRVLAVPADAEEVTAATQAMGQLMLKMLAPADRAD